MTNYMRWPRCSSVNFGFRRWCLLAGLLVVLSVHSGAVEKQPENRPTRSDYSMIGLRFGVWIDQGGSHSIMGDSLFADMPDAGFYTELFYDHRLLSFIMLEASLGIASRGDAVITSGAARYIGAIYLYPVLAQIKFMPLGGGKSAVQPFISGGAGVVFGRQATDFVRTSDPFFDPYLGNKTESDFTAVFGGGVDLALSEQLGFNVTARYCPINFSSTLAGVKDYSGISFSLGIAYFLHRNKT
jgi:hypothetical protein